MKVLIAPDSFKDSLSSLEVGKAIEAGIRMADPRIESEIFPLGDGGEGSAEILGHHLKAEKWFLEVENAIGRPVEASYYFADESKTAFIEMAEASGLQRIGIHERNCMLASTYGTGQMIRHAINLGAKRVVLAIGGSATNDAGMGMASALGIKLFDAKNNLLKGGGKELLIFHHFDEGGSFVPADLQVDIICDVDNPLYGNKGAAHVYARQKGANDDDIELLDKGLENFSKVMINQKGLNLADVPGAGAAGGLGAGSMAFLNASLHKGIDVIMDITGFDQHLNGVDLIITGEGKIDSQTIHGKLIHGISRHARQYSIPIIALCGMLELEPEEVKKLGLNSAFSIQSKPRSLEEALQNTRKDLTRLAFNIMRLLNSIGNK